LPTRDTSAGSAGRAPLAASLRRQHDEMIQPRDRHIF
jgi:hypothetical protein